MNNDFVTCIVCKIYEIGKFYFRVILGENEEVKFKLLILWFQINENIFSTFGRNGEKRIVRWNDDEWRNTGETKIYYGKKVEINWMYVKNRRKNVILYGFFLHGLIRRVIIDLPNLLFPKGQG